MIHIIENQPSANADRCEWVLIDDREGRQPKRYDFSTLRQLGKFIGAMKAKKKKTVTGS